MSLRLMKEEFEQLHPHMQGTMLHFEGVEGYDVYNCSIPFEEGGETYLYGRVEKRAEWANSHVRLFRQVREDMYTVVADAPRYELEDPFVQWIDGELVLGGTHVRKDAAGEVITYWCDFYRGPNTRSLELFSVGPDHMKDVRLVQVPGGVGVFSRPRTGDSASIGYIEIASLAALNADTIARAQTITNLMEAGSWGGCNQCYLLADGRIGVIGHMSYKDEARGVLSVYTNISFVFDRAAHVADDVRVIATRASYPQYPAKVPKLIDCAFTAGVVPREDGLVDLYSGIGDTAQGRVTIPNPFGQAFSVCANSLEKAAHRPSTHQHGQVSPEPHG